MDKAVPVEPTEGRPRWKGLRDWRVSVAIGVVVLVLAGLTAQMVHANTLNARLLQADGDLVSQDAALTRFAVAEAKPVYGHACASCHGADLKGNRVTGVPDLTDKDWLYGAGRVAEIEHIILYGIRSGQPRAWNLASMPAFGHAKPSATYPTPPLKPDQIRDVVQYLRLIEDKPADSAAAARGAKIYADAGQCFDCHANDGAGDQAIGAPNLIDDTWLYGDGSPEALYNIIANGRQGTCPGFSQRLKPDKIKALAVYLYTTSHPPGAARAEAGKQEDRS